jgi:hypothetical protein
MPTVTLDLATASILLDGAVIFTAPADYEPSAQLRGELDEMVDAGRITRESYRALQREITASPMGQAAARTRSWQLGGVS